MKLIFAAFSTDSLLFPFLIYYFTAVIPSNPSWCRMTRWVRISEVYLTLARTLNADVSGPLSYSFQIVATNTEGSASIPVTATITAPGRTARYPITSTLLSLASQFARQAGLWFADLFPPQSFVMQSQYAGLDNVRCL